MGDGDDLVQCVAMTVLAGDGADTVRGVADGSMVQAGPGQDFVSGDLDADVVHLGGGDDTANVANGAVDTVYGGAGSDVVRASSNDLLFSARPFSAPKPEPVVRPAATAGRVRCVPGGAARTLRLNNRASTTAVRYTVLAHRGVRTVRDTIRVSADRVTTTQVQSRRSTAVRVVVKAAGQRLLAVRVPAHC
jgi:Ca2+-binding RTX toxin-like protein